MICTKVKPQNIMSEISGQSRLERAYYSVLVILYNHILYGPFHNV